MIITATIITNKTIIKLFLSYFLCIYDGFFSLISACCGKKSLFFVAVVGGAVDGDPFLSVTPKIDEAARGVAVGVGADQCVAVEVIAYGEGVLLIGGDVGAEGAAVQGGGAAAYGGGGG